MRTASVRTSRTCLALILAVGFLLWPHAAHAGLTPTTTLQAETANNTSAATSAPPNGNAPPANTSKLDIHTLLYPGAATKVYATVLPWFGGSNHINVGYNSADPAQVQRQVADMISRGIDGAIIDWFGPSSGIIQDATVLFRQQAEAHPGFDFAIMEDSGALFQSAVANDCDVTTQFISDLKFIAANFVPLPAYVKVGGRPVIFLFGVTQFFIDWKRVAAELGFNPILLERGAGGFSESFAGGAFQWIDINSPDPFNPELSAQEAFYAAALQNGSRPAVGSVYKGFNDTLAQWSTNRFVDQRCGQTWIDTFADISKFYSSSRQLGFLQIVTWNDYEEGTAIEPGIDNCVFLTPSIFGNVLNWQVNGGNENTIDHYTVFASTDGQNLAVLANVPAGTHSLDLTSFGLTGGVYILYVKAVGKPSIQNKMSPAIAFRFGGQSPTVSLSVSETANLTVTANVSAFGPGRGNIASVTIDFGDGTVVQGLSATHTYAAVGQYIVTATVTNHSGRSAVANTRISAKAVASGVTIFTPSNGATVEFPTFVVASANMGNTVTGMLVWVDNKLVYITHNDTINTPLKIFKGAHTLVVQAFDATGASTMASIGVTAEPNDQPPVAVITERQIGPNTVLTCNVQSHDPDGFILLYQTQFSDGFVSFTPATVHTFAAPGTYSATANVMDQFGATASASTTFTVTNAAPATGAPSVEATQSAPQKQVYTPIRRP